MSKLIEKLNNLYKTATPSLGFRKSETEEKPLSMLLIVSMTGRADNDVKELGDAGITASVLDPAALSAGALGKYLKNRGNMPVGLLIDSNKALNGLKTITSDIDFIIFGADMAANTFTSKELEQAGRILKVKPAIELGLLRAVNNLRPSVDAILTDLTDASLTIEDLLNCQRISDHTGQPLIATVNKRLTEAELLGLRDAGVACLFIQSGLPGSDLVAMMESIKMLPRPVKRKEKGGVVLLPRLGARSDAKKGDEDDGEDDDD